MALRCLKYHQYFRSLSHQQGFMFEGSYRSQPSLELQKDLNSTKVGRGKLGNFLLVI